MPTVSKILENLDNDEGLELSKLEKSLKMTKKLDRDNLRIAVKALTKLGIIKSIEDEKIAINREKNGLYQSIFELENCLILLLVFFSL